MTAGESGHALVGQSKEQLQALEQHAHSDAGKTEPSY